MSKTTEFELVKVVFPGSKWNGKTCKVTVENQTIVGIQEVANGSTQKVLLPSFTDVAANFNDPGNEHKETLESGAKAAQLGGFSKVLLYPQTNPPTHNKAAIEYLVKQAQLVPIQLLPMGTVSHDKAGAELAELYDMHLSGAVAFYDGPKGLQNSGLLMKSLLYTKQFDGMVVFTPFDASIGGDLHVAEGLVSTKMGLKGIPEIAEHIALSKAIELLEYTDSKLFVHKISTAKSVELIQHAKQKGLNIYCSVSINNLIYTDEDYAYFDSNYKVFPPLRTKQHQEALINGVNSGVIDCIISDHQPHNIEAKQCEFEYADFGITGLQNFAANYFKYLSNSIDLEVFAKATSVNTNTIFGLTPCVFEEQSKADFTIIDTSKEFEFSAQANASISENNPELGTKYGASVEF